MSKETNIKISRSGFTIVELLIVIVVIGILATIVLNVVQGVQARARNAQTISMAGQYEKALFAYSAENGAYPFTSIECLGLGYDDHALGSLGDCYWNTTETNALQEDSAFMALVEPYIGDVAARTGNPVLYSSWLYDGPFVYYVPTMTIDGQPHTYYLMYVLEGYQVDCELKSLGGTWGTWVTTNTDNWYDTSTTYDATYCVVELPNP